MYERVLVAVDHSGITDRVLGTARELAQLSGGEVWVLHLRELQPAGKFAGAVATEVTEDVQQSTDAAVSKFTRAGVKAHGEVRRAVRLRRP